ncbi:MAG: hypothetical protein WCC57_15480 [Paracoccaceae bacterium]
MTTRLTHPRLWRNLALAGATAGLAATPLAAEIIPQMGATLWLAQAEGGEGGEAGAVANVSPDIAYLARLAIVEGHLVAATELYRKGMVDEAVGLSGHPEAEMMDEVRDTLTAHNAPDISPAMEELTNVMASAAPIGDVEAALARVQVAIAAAAAKGDAAPRVQIDALIALTRAAASEYAGSIKDGAIDDVMAFQEAHGFIEVAKVRAQILAASLDPVVASVGAKTLDTLGATAAAFDAIETTAPKPGDATILAAAAARIELAAFAVK